MVFCGFSSWDVGILRCCTHYDLIITLEQWMNRNFGYKCKGQKWERTRIVLVLDSKLNNKIYQLFMLGSYIFRTWNFVWKVYIAEATYHLWPPATKFLEVFCFSNSENFSILQVNMLETGSIVNDKNSNMPLQYTFRGQIFRNLTLKLQLSFTRNPEVECLNDSRDIILRNPNPGISFRK